MSRSKRFANSLVSGYVLLVANIIYTLVQGRMLLQFIHDNNEVGLWALAIQVAGYFLLLDIGMSGSISRILIDHKNKDKSSDYGSTIKTGFVVLLIQGAMIAIGGAIASHWLPEMTIASPTGQLGVTERVPISPEQMGLFRSLVMWQCILIGVSFATRMFGFILEAHQRQDISNHAQSVGFAVNLFVLWWGFRNNLGLYSLLWSNVASTILTTGWSLVSVWRLHLFPTANRWGQVSREKFRELFGYATDIFLLAIGNMLITASQVVVVTYSMGAGAAAIWSFTTKTFGMANQFIGRIYNYSSPAFAEMTVRGETARLRERFRDVATLSASSGVLITMCVAACNYSFLRIWTGSDRMSWSITNDLLMALYIFSFNTTRCHVGLVCISKDLRAMKFVYVVEGIAFIGLAAMLGHWIGFPGIILAGIVTNLSFSGFYGMHRSANILGLPLKEIIFGWLSFPMRFLLVMVTISVACHYLTQSLPIFWQLCSNAVAVGALGALSFWKFGLPKNLQVEFGGRLNKLRSRFQSEA